MIDILKDVKDKPITYEELKVGKLFTFKPGRGYSDLYPYYITSYDKDVVKFFNLRSSITTAVSRATSLFLEDIIFLDEFAESKELLNAEKYREISNEYKSLNDNLVKLSTQIQKIDREYNAALNTAKDCTKLSVYADKIKMIRDAFLYYYEADNLSNRVIDGCILEIAIKFPEIIITNSKKLKHTIKDLIVFVNINLDSMKLQNHIRGYRGSWSAQEAMSGYAHSHLNSNLSQPRDFCLGSSEMAILVTEMKSTPLTQQKLEFFCGSLDQYVRWESLEGTPYISISAINTTENLHGISPTYKETYYKKFIENKVPFKLTFDAINEKFNVTIAESDLLALIPQDSDLRVTKINNTYCSVNTLNRTDRDATDIVARKASYYFDGERRPQIYKAEIDAINTIFYPHPSLTEYIKLKLEEAAFKHLILEEQ